MSAIHMLWHEGFVFLLDKDAFWFCAVKPRALKQLIHVISCVSEFVSQFVSPCGSGIGNSIGSYRPASQNGLALKRVDRTVSTVSLSQANSKRRSGSDFLVLCLSSLETHMRFSLGLRSGSENVGPILLFIAVRRPKSRLWDLDRL